MNMITSGDYGGAGPHVYEIAEELRTNFTIRGEPYNNIILSTTEPGFTDEHDPEVRTERDAETLYWPGGSALSMLAVLKR